MSSHDVLRRATSLPISLLEAEPIAEPTMQLPQLRRQHFSPQVQILTPRRLAPKESRAEIFEDRHFNRPSSRVPSLDADPGRGRKT